MKIIRASGITEEERPFGRTVKKLFEYLFPKEASSIVLYLNNLPDGRFDPHYHSKSFEIVIFPKGGMIEVNGSVFNLGVWDLVFLEPGDVHGYTKLDCGNVLHLAIKIQADDDKVSK